MEQFEADWADLSEGLRKIYAGERLHPNYYMQLYNHVFNFSGESAREILYSKLRAFIAEHVNNLYQQLNTSSEQGEQFLEHYIALWNAYKFGSFVTNAVFAYLNRHWVNREMEGGNKEVRKVYDLAMNILKTEMFDKVLPKIIYCSANVLMAEENGSAEDKVRIRALIKAVCESFFEYGLKFIFQLAYGEADQCDSGEGNSKAESENYAKYRKLFMGRLLDATDKRLRGEAPPETVLQITELNQKK